jgi:hypothetical protein
MNFVLLNWAMHANSFSKVYHPLLSSADIRRASEGGPQNEASGPYAELHFSPPCTFHGPYKQQKYGHRQSLDGDPGFFYCMHTS